MVVTKVGIYGPLTALINNPRPDFGLEWHRVWFLYFVLQLALEWGVLQVGKAPKRAIKCFIFDSVLAARRREESEVN